jgi:DnaJ-class molecular chaperone
MLIYHLILGLPDDATDAEIRSRYLELVKKYPPEKAPVRFQQITEAYEAVRTQHKRIEGKLFGYGSSTAGYADQLQMLVDAVEFKRRRVGLGELFEAEKQCLKK